MIPIELIHNLTLLTALSLVSGFFTERWSGRARLGAVVQGLLFGGASVLGILTPVPIAPGIFLDGRTVMLSLGAFFFGPITAAVALVLVFSARILVGGQGAWMGCLVSANACAVALLFRHHTSPEQTLPGPWRLFVLGQVVHLLVGILFLIGMPRILFQTAILPLLTLYPLATILVGKVLTDLLRRRRAEELLHAQNQELQRANSEKERLLCSTTHDIRAPLRAAVGLLDLIEDPETSEEEARTYHGMLRGALERSDRTIRDTLEYARQTRESLMIEEVNIRALAEDCLKNLLPLSQARAVQFDIDIPPDLIFQTDQTFLRTALQNVMTNAVMYQNAEERAPRVSLRAERRGDHLRLQIEDNGEGISPEQQGAAFTMFNRSSHKSRGTGLGLYLSRRVVEQLGGTIELTSTPGVGSLFTINLPPAGGSR